MTPSFSPRRRMLLQAAAAGVAWQATGARAAVLPAAKSLAAELAVALRMGRPLIVMASLEGCPLCRMARDSYLAPMLRETGQPVVQLDMGSEQPVRDFQGAGTTHAAMLRAWSVRVAPTVLFFGSGGRELAPRLAGAPIADFYGAYLEDRLKTARLALG